MHVALVCPGWPLEKHHNGIVTYVHWMKLELERMGHRVSVFTGELDADGPLPRVYRVQRGWWGRWARRHLKRFFPFARDVFTAGRPLAACISRVHRRDPIDVIEMEESFGWFAEVARSTGLPLLVKLHGPAFISMIDEELVTSFGKLRVAREGEALAQVEAIAAPARITLEDTLTHYRLAPRIQAHVVNPLSPAPDLPLWKLEHCDRNEILFVGRFDKRKGGDVILRAFALLLKERPGLRLVFVGPDYGLLQDDGTRVHFEEFCGALFPDGSRDRVDYRGLMVNREIGKLRAHAMVTVVASRWENQGYTVLEALLQGCPVVSSDAGGCPESVVDGRTGLLATSDDPAAYAEKIAAMLDAPEAAAAMGVAGRAYVLSEHSTAKVASESVELYRRVIEGHRA